jgi:hypothetical protein
MEYPREETGLSSHQEHGKSQHSPQQDRQTVENFKHQLEASLLLDQVLVIIKAAEGIESKVSHLLAVGTKLKDFLSAGLGENGWAWGASCSALAIAIRYVFSDMGYLWH